MACFLYLIRLPTNDYAPAYVGITKNPARRFYNHKNNKNSFIGQAIRACGAQNVVFQIAVCGSAEYISNLERTVIDIFKTRFHGYNLAAGGYHAGLRDALPSTRAKLIAANAGKVLSWEHKARIAAGLNNPATRAARSAALTGRILSPEHKAKILRGVIGRTVTPETREKLSAINTGRKVSPEWAAKISAAKKGKSNPKLAEALRGRTATVEAKANMAAAHLGKKMSPESVAKTAAWHRGKKRPLETRLKIAARARGRVVSDEVKQKIAKKMREIRAARFWSCKRQGDPKMQMELL